MLFYRYKFTREVFNQTEVDLVSENAAFLLYLVLPRRTKRFFLIYELLRVLGIFHGRDGLDPFGDRGKLTKLVSCGSLGRVNIQTTVDQLVHLFAVAVGEWGKLSRSDLRFEFLHCRTRERKLKSAKLVQNYTH